MTQKQIQDGIRFAQTYGQTGIAVSEIINRSEPPTPEEAVVCYNAFELQYAYQLQRLKDMSDPTIDKDLEDEERDCTHDTTGVIPDDDPNGTKEQDAVNERESDEEEEEEEEEEAPLIVLSFMYKDASGFQTERLKTDGNGNSIKERMDAGADATDLALAILGKFNKRLREGESERVFVALVGAGYLKD